MKEDIKLILKVFENWDKRQIQYCILRNYEDIYERIDNDVDILVDPQRYNEALDIMQNTAKEEKWRLHLIIPKDHLIGIHFNKIVNDELNLIHIDLFKDIAWKGLSLINTKTILASRQKFKGIYIPNRTIESIIMLLGRLMHQGHIKNKYKIYIRDSVIQDTKNFENTILHLFHHNIVEKIIYSIREQQWQDIEKNINKIKSSFIRKKIEKNIFKYLLDKIQYYIYLITKIVHPKGICIALLGPDGSGKSSVSKGIIENLKKTFGENVKVSHWRPRILPDIKSLLTRNKNQTIMDVSEPHKLEPYSCTVSFVRFLYYWLDYVIGYFALILPTRIKGGMVIFDRYYYDYYIDKRRFRLNISDSILKIFEKLVPKPDKVFYLRSEPQIIYNRKNELPLKEIDRQIKELDKLFNRLKKGTIIETSEDIDIVINKICIDILKELLHE